MLKIKPEYGHKIVLFGEGYKPLRERSQAELKKLAIIAQRSQDASLLVVFEAPLPSLDELQQERTSSAIRKINDEFQYRKRYEEILNDEYAIEQKDTTENKEDSSNS